MSKQMKISDLKRVVNVDKIKKYADILKNENNRDEIQIETILKELSEKTPSREILLQTRLGFILRDLSARESLPMHLRDQARDLRTKWKEFHKSLLLAPKFDVKCDKPTTESRENSKQTLRNQFLRSNSSSEATVFFEADHENQLVADLEFTIFKHSDSLIGSRYFSTVRKCLRVIAENSEIRNLFLTYQMQPEEFLNRSLKHQTFSSEVKSDVHTDTSNSLVTLD